MFVQELRAFLRSYWWIGVALGLLLIAWLLLGTIWGEPPEQKEGVKIMADADTYASPRTTLYRDHIIVLANTGEYFLCRMNAPPHPILKDHTLSGMKAQIDLLLDRTGGLKP